MASRPPDGESTSGGEDLDPIEEAVAGYLEELDRGKPLEPAQILAKHRTNGPQILAGLEQFVELGGRFSAGDDLGVIGDYRLQRQVGRGGMGVVYEAWQESMDRRVALKVLPAGTAADTRAVTRFIREARVAGRLQHSNIVSVYGTGVEAHTPYYAMEFVEGETLAQLLERLRAAREKPGEEKRDILSSVGSLFHTETRRKRPPPGPPDPSFTCGVEDAALDDDPERQGTRRPSDRRQEIDTSGVHGGADEVNLQYCLNVARAFARVAEGLQYAHDKGVIHRDLKPSNLILDREGQVRILDFGLARLEGQESITQSGEFLGTPLYMSPEQALASRIPLDHRTDIYSLGATLYEMLTWQPPFPGKDHHDTISQIIFRDPTPLRRLNSRIPRDLETIVLKCLRKDPRDRFSTAEALAQDLDRFVRGDPVEARPQPAWERATRRAWRQKGRIAALSVFLLLGLTSALLLHIHIENARKRDLNLYNETVLGAMVKLELADQSRENPKPRREAEAEQPGKRGLLSAALAAEADAGRDWSRRVREAVEDLRRAAALLPRRPEARYHLARGLRILGRTDEADQALSGAIESDRAFVPAWILREAMLAETGTPRNASPGGRPEPPDAQGPLAETWLKAHRAAKEKRWKEAGEAYGKLLDLELPVLETYLGLSLEVRLGRGRSHLEAKDFDGALEDFAAVQALWPDLVEPALLLGKTHWRKGSRDRALEIFEQLYRKSGASDDAAFKVAELLGDLQEHDLGLAWAERLKDPARREVQRSSFLRKLGRLEEAIAAADRALEIDGRLARASYLRGRARWERGDLAGAIADFSEALRIDPGHEEAYLWRANVRDWIHEGEREILADTSRVIELNPAHHEAHLWRGEIRYERGDFEGAARDLGRAMDLASPGNFHAVNRLTWMWGRREELDLQIAALSRAIRANPGEINLCHRRNLLHEKKGDHRALAAGAEELLALAPEKTGGNVHFSAACAYSIAAALVRKDENELDREALEGKYAGQALEALGKAFEGGFTDYLRVRGEADLDHLRGLPEFLELIEKVSERNQAADPNLLAMIGEGRFLRKDFRSAVRILEEALQHPNAAQSLARRLEEYRRAALPDLVSYGSIDWAIDNREVLVPEGAEWRFFRGRSSPSPRLEWTHPDYDDSSWEKGPSGFGYGDGDDATLLQDMRFDYSTVYLRRELTLSDLSRSRSLTLSVVADDGFVAYLNGREVGRQRAGTPGTPLPSDFMFGGLARDGSEPLELPLDPADLLAGRNVIAIQGVNHRIHSTDFSLIPVVHEKHAHEEAREGELLANFRAVASGSDAPARISYLEGALLERAGKHREAAAKFEEAFLLGRARPEPCLRLARSLRAAGDPAAAEALLHQALEGEWDDVEALWDLWFEVSAVDLRRGAEEILGSFPASTPGGAARRSDLRWLLGELSRSGAVRINSGGDDYSSPRGVFWGRDRFFAGGYRYFGDAQFLSHEPYTGEIKNTEDDVLYRTGRYFPGPGLRTPGYRIPLPGGRYRVTLHFAEIFNNNLGETLFEVKLEGKSILEGYEPLFAGFRTADARSAELEVTDGFLDIELVHECRDPSISAIEVREFEALPGDVTAAGSGAQLTRRELAERHYLRGFARMSLQDYGHAIASFNETLEIDPEHHLARWHRALAKLRRRDWGGAISDFTQFLKLEPGDAWTHYRLGLARMENDLDGAIAEATRALELDPGYVEAYCLRADARGRMKDWDGALDDCGIALAIDPGFHVPHSLLGMALVEKKDVDGGIAAFTQALSINPDHGPAYNNRGIARWRKRDLEGAIADFTEALRVAPDNAISYQNRAFASLDRNDLDGAIADITEALKLEPDNARMQERRAAIHERRGDLDRALRDLARAIEIDPKMGAARKRRIDILEQQGDLDGAIAECDAFLEVEPENISFRTKRTYLLGLLAGKGDWRAATQAVDAWLARQSGKTSWGELHNAACVYSRASEKAAREAVSDRETESSQRYAARAVELLDQAMEQGEPFDIVGGESDFEPIRGHVAYRALFEKWSARKGGRDPEVLAILAEAQTRQGDPQEGILSLEKALRLPGARRDLAGILDERRAALLPDLVSYASVDAALESREDLISEAAEWRFFRGRSEPSAGQEWTGPDFDDSSWERGRGPFGYGDGRKDLTVLSDMNGNYSSLYIRCEFQVPDPARFRSLTLSLNADDGCIAYLNGEAVEWLRAGGPETQVPFDGVSRGANDFTLETRVRLPPGLLRAGKNVIAIHGLNRMKQDGGFGLRASLWGDPILGIEAERERFEAFRQAAKGDDAPLRLAYLEGRILQRAGRLGEAAARFDEIVSRDGKLPEPWLRLCECLRASGEPSRAEARLRDALARGGMVEDEALWDLWFAVSALDLERTAAEISNSLPEEAPGARGGDLRWLLEEISKHGVVRIRCGGDEYRSPAGKVWGRDRFFRGGDSWTPAVDDRFDGSIGGTEDDPLYLSERWFGGNQVEPAGYRVPLPPGLYRVALHFAEVDAHFGACRRFDLEIEGKLRLLSYEPAEAGFATADVRRFEVRVEDGFLDLVFIPLCHRPKISALEIEALPGK